MIPILALRASILVRKSLAFAAEETLGTVDIVRNYNIHLHAAADGADHTTKNVILYRRPRKKKRLATIEGPGSPGQVCM